MLKVTLERELRSQLPNNLDKCLVAVVTNYPHKQFNDNLTLTLDKDQTSIAVLQFVGKTLCPEGMYAKVLGYAKEYSTKELEYMRAKNNCKHIYNTPFLLEGSFRAKYVDIVKDPKKAKQAEDRMIQALNDKAEEISKQTLVVEQATIAENFFPQKYLDEFDKLKKLEQEKRVLYELFYKMF